MKGNVENMLELILTCTNNTSFGQELTTPLKGCTTVILLACLYLLGYK